MVPPNVTARRPIRQLEATSSRFGGLPRPLAVMAAMHPPSAAGSGDEHGVELVQSRFVTEDVARMARFYAALIGTDVVVNDYYVEVPTPAQRVAVSRRRFSDLGRRAWGPRGSVPPGAVILDFAAADLDAEHTRIAALGVEWLLPPTMQPWGRRSMLLRDPEGHFVSVFEKREDER